MEIKKVNLDRVYLSSSQIEQKQNFQFILNCAKMTKPPTRNSPLFYGAIGLSSIAAAAISSAEEINKYDLNDKITTSKIQMIMYNKPVPEPVHNRFMVVSFFKNKRN